MLSIVKGHGDLTNHIILPCEYNMSRNDPENLLLFGRDVHLDSKMNCLEFGGQGSRSLWPHKTCIGPFEHDISSLLLQNRF